MVISNLEIFVSCKCRSVIVGFHRECPSFEAIFVWCKNSPPTRLPPSVGFKVGGKHRTKTLILQIHYDHPLTPEEADYSGHDIIFTREEYFYNYMEY